MESQARRFTPEKGNCKAEAVATLAVWQGACAPPTPGPSPQWLGAERRGLGQGQRSAWLHPFHIAVRQRNKAQVPGPLLPGPSYLSPTWSQAVAP